MTPRVPPVPPPRKPYRAPELRVYGNIHAITRAVGSSGVMDGGTVAGMMMTR